MLWSWYEWFLCVSDRSSNKLNRWLLILTVYFFVGEYSLFIKRFIYFYWLILVIIIRSKKVFTKSHISLVIKLSYSFYKLKNFILWIIIFKKIRAFWLKTKIKLDKYTLKISVILGAMAIWVLSILVTVYLLLVQNYSGNLKKNYPIFLSSE